MAICNMMTDEEYVLTHPNLAHSDNYWSDCFERADANK